MPSFEQVILKTARLVLRPLAAADAPTLLAIFSDPVIMRYWSSPPWASIDEAHAMVARDQKAMATGEYLRFGVVQAGTDRLIGTCTLFSINTACRRAEVGYSLAQSAWGQGYMHEALRALLEYGFTEMQLNRVEADIDPRNTASARSLDRLGFTREGFLRERWIVNGEVSDTALYGLLQREWFAAQTDSRGET
jgi:RimJ/RimL family protein N-acetyltransferase